MRKRRDRRQALGMRALRVVPHEPNKRWSLNFVSDRLGSGRNFHILVVGDNCMWECLVLVVDTLQCGQGVARKLDRIIKGGSKPLLIVPDNGTKLNFARHSSLAGGESKPRRPKAATQQSRRFKASGKGIRDALYPPRDDVRIDPELLCASSNLRKLPAP